MRCLSKKQKRILKDYTKDGYFNDDLLINKYGNRIILIKQLEKINDYETLYNDLNRLIHNLRFESTLENKLNIIDNFR